MAACNSKGIGHNSKASSFDSFKFWKPCSVDAESFSVWFQKSYENKFLTHLTSLTPFKLIHVIMQMNRNGKNQFNSWNS